VTVRAVTEVTSGPHTGERTTSALHENIRASVQPASNAEAIRHGLTTDRPVFWARFAESPPKVGDQVVWRGRAYRVESVSEGEGIDTQVLMRLDGSAP